VAKRRLALAEARPFIAATVGFCDAYIYMNGLLCYTLDERVRILDLHHSAHQEIVLHIPGLLTQALFELGDKSKGTFRILYCASEIISCIYKSSGPDSRAWLIAFNISVHHPRKERILITYELESSEKIFVRHNENFLYYGTHSEHDTDGYRKWAIQGFHLKTKKKLDPKIILTDLVGSEISSTVCFELHNGYFYALSNQTSFEVEEIDWTSFYHCILLPLQSPHRDLVEKTENHRMWRRQHQEGPIDDRWTSIRLHRDRETREL